MRSLFGRKRQEPTVEPIETTKKELVSKLQMEYDKAKSRQRSQNSHRPQKPSGFMRGVAEAIRIIEEHEVKK